MSSVPNMNDPYIKDLLIKFDVLKKALVEERKKTQSLEKKITEMQVYSSNKDNEIAELCKAKHDLESQLVLEKKKTEGKITPPPQTTFQKSLTLPPSLLQKLSTSNVQNSTTEIVQDNKKDQIQTTTPSSSLITPCTIALYNLFIECSLS